LPSAKGLSVAFGTFSIGALSVMGSDASGLKHWFAGSAMAVSSLSLVGEGWGEEFRSIAGPQPLTRIASSMRHSRSFASAFFF
jgi:hypothetical protein